MKTFLVATTLICAVSVFAAESPTLTGNWNIHTSIAGNESDQPCKFVFANNKLTGSCKGQDANDVPIAGSVDGNKLTWKYESQYNGAPLTMTYTATLDGSGKISGTVEVQPFAVTGDFTATPIKDAAK